MDLLTASQANELTLINEPNAIEYNKNEILREVKDILEEIKQSATDGLRGSSLSYEIPDGVLNMLHTLGYKVIVKKPKKRSNGWTDISW